MSQRECCGKGRVNSWDRHSLRDGEREREMVTHTMHTELDKVTGDETRLQIIGPKCRGIPANEGHENS